MPEAEEIIAQLRLQPLEPEGGYFARTWTQPGANDGNPAATAIYFLLTPETFSAFHRLEAAELWHFYAGDPVDHWQLREHLPAEHARLGPNILAGEIPQLVVPSGVWQAARISRSRERTACGWSLLGCTMSPGWRDEHFELGLRERLVHRFPSAAGVIRELTRA